MEWKEVEGLARWVLRKRFKQTDPDELIGECYIAYEKCSRSYDPAYSNFSTYYRTYLEGHIKDYITANTSVVSVTKHYMKRGETTHIDSITSPIADTETTLEDILSHHCEEEHAEEKEQAVWLSIVDDLYPNLSAGEKHIVPYMKKIIIEGDTYPSMVPRQYRTQMWKLRQKMLERKNLLDN